ncbi:MAG: lytic murein transglycosylase [Patescibacteria group bacterium]|nr:lytic murein transglycosylase [Patescibacteria group bacterium]
MGLLDKLFKKSLFLAALFSLFLITPFFIVRAASNDSLKKDLENQIKQKQEEIVQHEQSIQNSRQKAKTLKNEIQIIESQIKKIRAEVKQLDLVIQESALNIREVDGQISILEDKIGEKKDLLAEYIRTVAHYDQETLLEVILKNEKFSDFFDEINALESAQEKIHSILSAVRAVKEELNIERQNLEEERIAQGRLKSLQLAQKRTVENKQWQKEDLLEKTRGEERLYQQMIQGNKEEIIFIKEQLVLLKKYNLTEEEMVRSAIFAGAKTGIRPAYLLGVLENESRLGLNVGTGNWRNDMYQCNINRGYITMGTNLKNAFLQICQELGLNPDTQPVSARPSAYKGCGGAMGIAQFMPTTWLAYKDRISAMTGNNPPNPWRPVDAFTASAIKLADAGARAQTYQAERRAYAIYIGGKYWRGLLSIADRAMRYADGFQKQYFD